MKDLILSTSYSFSREKLEPFMASLRKTDFGGDLVFFVGNTDRETKRWLKEEGVKVLPLFYPYKNWNMLRNPLYHLWPYARPLLSKIKNPSIIARICAPFQNLTTLRYLLYHRYLQSMPNRYRFVLLTDLRDVYFQANPFIRAQPGQLRVFAEEPNYTIGSSLDNARWIREALGEEIVSKIADQPISCSGTTIGDQVSMQCYLDAFMRAVGGALSTMRIGSDQGIHNFLVHIDLKDSVTLCPNRESEILTMGFMPRDEKFARDEQRRFVDASGNPYTILHQYDRHDAVKRELQERSRSPRHAIQ